MKDRRCVQTRNVYGYLMSHRCGDAAGVGLYHEPHPGISNDAGRRSCAHHVYLPQDEFKDWVIEVLSGASE
jgi:hypothetical protein